MPAPPWVIAGTSRRDRIAEDAMKQMLLVPDEWGGIQDIVESSYKIADEMIKAGKDGEPT